MTRSRCAVAPPWRCGAARGDAAAAPTSAPANDVDPHADPPGGLFPAHGLTGKVVSGVSPRCPGSPSSACVQWRTRMMTILGSASRTLSLDDPSPKPFFWAAFSVTDFYASVSTFSW